ncbi:sulfhydryl oxidase [Chloropicon primus]|uniref:Sulfhydryl oxidase n=1 Tax=Chloropicon primus TaxID=1764295 RepID=A0A5B8MJF5_9CHLO|nr:sulfhydryl oxidase [Chloropicon primus]UPQ99424.1 sulfhydryl oxidase [Chloropicon primus]|eukprot:QDZ20214.1 sulfhydryl oxidase [Chloropicon primus]
MEECEERVCRSKVDLFNTLRNRTHKQSNIKNTTNNTNTNTNTNTKDSKEELVRAYHRHRELLAASSSSSSCPLDREELGARTWGLLHTVAAYYPARPTPRDAERAGDLVRGLAHLYPCAHCREDFAREVEAKPPRLESRAAFSVWVCEQHNLVNDKLGKPPFSCALGTLDERWRVGSERCQPDGESASESLGQQ